jgi:tRNA G18 (ribose-2'-O)-methylase SpoU
VGAFFRTCDGLGVNKIIFSGYTPYPKLEADTRLPHFADKITRQIHKTALGAETTVPFERFDTIEEAVEKHKESTFIALEQHPSSKIPAELTKILKDKKVANAVLILGNEIHGVSEDVLSEVDYIMEIPMKGDKESFNVSIACGIALYELTKSI